MYFKPMSYDSVKIVLEYLELNKRIQIGCRCPSIRGAERAAPLRINYLMFKPGSIHVNSDKYHVSITKKYHVGKLSELAPPGKSGYSCEVDKFGNEIPSDAAIVTPGDVKIGEVLVADNDGFFEQLLQEINQNMSWKCSEDELEYMNNVLPSELLPYYYRRKNMVLPYEQMVQVTLEAHRTKHSKTELYVHNQPHSAAMKQLGKYLFGGRRGRIHVKEFRVLDGGVIRLPLGVMFHIVKLNLAGNWSDEIIPLVQNSCYPFKHLHIQNLSLAEVSSPIVNGAGQLTINQFDRCLALLSNRSVHVRSIFPRPTPEDFTQYIETWIKKKRSIGTCHEFSFDFREGNLIRTVMEAIFDRFGGELTGTGSLISSMTEISKLEVSNKQVRDVCWILQLTVVDA